MSNFVRSALLLTLVMFAGWAPRAQARNLEIYWIDVEGGAATLVVSPSGESLLYDAGWETDGRDAKRIAAVAHEVGLKRIDAFVLSHFHADHAGGIQGLATLIPIARCFDRGDLQLEPANRRWLDAYLSACGDKRVIVKVGDRLPLKSVRVDIVASNGQLVPAPKGRAANPLCATAENRAPEGPENQFMVGALFTFGRFRFLDLADLDWEKEMELACPVNRLGEVTIWQAGRHGALDGAGAPGLLYSIKPQVVVVNNGPRKGLGGPSAGQPKPQTIHYDRIVATPGIEGIWQGHRSLLDPDHNTAEDMIANLEDTAQCQGHWIRASVARDGSYAITNGRNGFTRMYKAR